MICPTEIQTNHVVMEVFKPYGMTPKELVEECVQKHNAKKGSFSGRLDPMACGVMKVFLDDSCKLATAENALSKTYRFVIVFGITSSSCDILGIPRIGMPLDYSTLLSIESLSVKTGEIIQKLPIHSSFVVSNKEGLRQPLWRWALENRIGEVDIPSFKRTLFSFDIKKRFSISLSEIATIAVERVSLVKPNHNFGQDDIIRAWKQLMTKDVEFPAMEIVTTVSSGFYIRQLVSDIGEQVGTSTLTLEIERLSYCNL